LTGKVYWQFAYDVAQTNNFPHRLSHEDKITGDNFYYGFIARYPEISLRHPQATSVARVRGFWKENNVLPF
jgi:hypothetical protein